MTKRIALCAAIVLAASGIARAGTLDPIAIRQAGMALQGGDFAYIRAWIATKGDVGKLEEPAKAIALWAKLIPSVFPPGSEKGENTKALPEIWSDRAGFEKIAATMGVASMKLAAAAKAGDAAEVAVDAKEVGKQCGACHHDYRAK